MKRLATAAALALLCAAASCTKIPERYSPEPPRIILESDEPIYRIKVNEPLKLTPTVENAGDDAAYRWSIEGEVVGYEPTFTYVGTEAGSVYLLFEVINDSGQDEAEMRIDVMPYRFPAITLVVPANGYSLLRGEELTFSPEVDNAEVSAFEWKVNGTTVSATQEYTFRGEETGEYAYKEVVRTFVNTTEEITHVTISDSEGVQEVIDSTPQHPFYVEGKGWVEASALHAGMTIWFANGTKGTVADISNEGLEEPVTVYNFEVADFHTYFVGESGALVHNTCITVEQNNPNATGQEHHPISNKIERAAQSTENLNDLSRLDTGTITASTLDDHKGYQKWHREIDDAVVSWIESNPSASVDDFVEQMNNLYGTDEMVARFENVIFKKG